MANWKDGPRYAPVEHPVGFAAPAESISLELETGPAALEPLPPIPPHDYQPQGESVPLADLKPVVVDQRDPKQPFAIVTSVLTSIDAASLFQKTSVVDIEASDQPDDPRKPFKVSTSTSLMASTWGPPPDDAKPARITYPVAVKDILTAAYPPLLIGWALAGIVGANSWFLGLLVTAVTAFTILPRVRFRVESIKKITYAILGVITLGWLISTFLASSMYNIDLGLGWWVFAGSWGLAIAVIIQQWQALKHGEKP